MPLFKTHCLLFILLAVASITSHAWIAQYEQTGSELLTGYWKYKSSENSRVDSTSTGLNLYSNDATTITSIHQDIPTVALGSILLLSADVKCNDVLTGKKPWNQARLLLLQNDGRKDRWDLPSVVTSLTGTQDWKNYQGIFTVLPETQRIQVIAQVNQTIGSLQINNIQLYPVSETHLFAMARNITLLAWSAFFLLLIGSCLLIKKNILLRLLLVFAFAFIIIGTTLPGDVKNQVSDEVLTQLHAQSEPHKTTILWDLSKVWHFCSFFLFGLIICLMMTQESLTQVTIVIVLLAGGTELAQLYIDGRTPLVTDFFIDAAGGIAGMILIWFAKIRRDNHPSDTEIACK